MRGIFGNKKSQRPYVEASRWKPMGDRPIGMREEGPQSTRLHCEGLGHRKKEKGWGVVSGAFGKA